MPKFYKIAVIGAGNVAWHLARAFEDAGHYITDIYSRRITNAKELADRLYDTNTTSSLDLTTSDAEIFLVAVPDDAIDDVVKELKIPPYAVVAHTSGTKTLTSLSDYHGNCGIFYPLQTFTKGGSIELKEVPICIEASHGSTEKILLSLGETISGEVYSMPSEDRQVLHVAAVFACNFSNHMFAIAQDILEDHDIDINMLHPLIVETVNKALSLGPVESQTGPAQRGDEQTIKIHLKFLKDVPGYRKIYKLLTDHIKESYS
jgi:predicted short-subunit dehydrogenase-like oxidoreductase (DUF2520 family)